MKEACLAFSLSESFDFDNLSSHCSYQFNSKILRDVIVVDFQNQEFHIFAFGVVIFWGERGYNPELFFSQIKQFFINPSAEKTFDFFQASIIEKGSEFKIRRDNLELHSSDPFLRVAISFAMAQSVKLGEMEEYVQEEISKHSVIPIQLAEKGELKLSRKEMAKIRGQIFVTESRINLKYDLLDKPEFLWDNPEYDEFYQRTYDYLEVHPRIEILNKKLSVLRDILNILADGLQHSHSTKLEWIIIILIAIEIVMSLVEYGIKIFY